MNRIIDNPRLGDVLVKLNSEVENRKVTWHVTKVSGDGDTLFLVSSEGDAECISSYDENFRPAYHDEKQSYNAPYTRAYMLADIFETYLKEDGCAGMELIKMRVRKVRDDLGGWIVTITCMDGDTPMGSIDIPYYTDPVVALRMAQRGIAAICGADFG